MEKKKTGEFFAAKVVSREKKAFLKRFWSRDNFTENSGFLTVKYSLGKSTKELKEPHAVLGEQAYT